MERIFGFIMIAWLAVMGIGLIIALLPIMAFVAGFVGMIALVVFVGRLLGSWLFY